MPGFSLILDPGGDDDSCGRRFAAALEQMRHNSRYSSNSVVATPEFRLGWTGYGGYPIRVWEFDDAILLVEGFIYNPDPDSLSVLLSDRFTAADQAASAQVFLRDFAVAADGDFAIVWFRRSPPQQLIVALDPLGRLPTYWAMDGRRLLVSREVKFITSLHNSVQPDRDGIAQTLAMGFPFEQRTLIDGISRLPAGTILTWTPSEQSAPMVTPRPWCFDTDRPVGKAESEYVAQLADEFTAGCRRRVSASAGGRMFLSLSGGLDSRVVAAGLGRIGAPVEARTFVYDNYREAEAHLAESVAGACGLVWQSVTLSPVTLDAADRLVRMKDGLNSAAIAYAEEYLTSLASGEPIAPVFFTGEGGDCVAVARHPHRPIRSNGELAELLLSRSAVLDPTAVEALMGMRPGTLRDQLTAVLDRFPEHSLPDRHLHFFVLESKFKQWFEGEDRNRCYLWPIAPFYARPFFDLAMRAPYDWKKRRRLIVALIRRLNPDAATIRNSNTGFVPGTFPFRAHQWTREMVLSHRALETVFRAWRQTRVRYDAPPWVISRIAAVAAESNAVRDIFPMPPLQELIRRPLTAPQAWQLYTVVRYISQSHEAQTRP